MTVLAIALALAAAVQAAPQPPGRLIDVEGHLIHLYCTGKGSPTVMIVGGGFSFDWGLVQPGIAQFTRVCAYDPPGTAWSDPIPQGTRQDCSSRAKEIHILLQKAAIEGPYVLVGYSIGGLYARLYAQTYPKEVAGMVIADHAFTDFTAADSKPPAAQREADAPPVLILQTPITLGIEDDRNFSKLPRRDRDLHTWAMANGSVRPTAAEAEECASEIEAVTQGHTSPLGQTPLILISTRNDSSGYAELQARLLRLSSDSRQIIAENSSHMVLIDEPEIIVRAVRQVVNAVLTTSALP